MMADLCEGAVLGVVFAELYKAIADATMKATGLDSHFKKLEKTLKNIEPDIVTIENLRRRLDRPEEVKSLKQILDDGKALIGKCSKVSRYNCWKKWRYAIKIEEFENNLTSLCQRDLQVQSLGNGLETLDAVKSSRSFLRASENLGSCEAPNPPDFMVGLDARLKELKSWLLEDQGSMAVVSAHTLCERLLV